MELTIRQIILVVVVAVAALLSLILKISKKTFPRGFRYDKTNATVAAPAGLAFAIFEAATVNDILSLKKASEEWAGNAVIDEHRNQEGWTALMFLAYNGCETAIHYLVAAGADLNAKDAKLGKTALHLAAGNDHGAVCLILLDEGASRTETDNLGWSPLHLAACNGHAGAVRLLIDEGLSISATDNNGKTPLDVARQCSTKKSVIKILEQAEADAAAAAAAPEEQEKVAAVAAAETETKKTR